MCDNPALDLPKKARPRIRDVLFFVAGVGLILVSFLDRTPFFKAALCFSVQGIALFPIFVTAVRFPDWGPMRLLNLRPVRYVGTISYTLYLIHEIVIFSTSPRWSLSPPISVALQLLISIGIASIVWHFVEKPFGVLRRRLTSVTAPAYVLEVEPVVARGSSETGLA